ncbi:MAG: AEC family transporter [Clostridia bacterium]|nr:AEC family transporter [Clostridia bacterium]
MKTFIATLMPMLTLFICIAIGFFIGKSKILPDNAGKTIAKMETWIFCPALNFMTMVRFCTIESIGTHSINIVMSAFGVALSIFIAICLSHLFVKENSPERGIYAYALAFSNGGYMGDPIVLALFGEVGLSYYKLFYLPFSLMINSWGISVLTPSVQNKNSIWRRLLNMPTISMLLGMTIGLTGLGNYLPTFLTDSLDTLKVCMGPVAMLLAGITISKYNLISMLKKGKVYIASAFRLVLLPIVIVSFMFGLKALASEMFSLKISNDILFLTFFATAMPLGLNTVVFPEAYGGNPETGASMAIISHTLCVISIPILYAVMVTTFGTPFI